MSIEWLLIRGSGLAAFGLLAAATLWGLLISTKVLGRAVKAKPVTWFHESLGLGALFATVVHMVALVLHDYVDFTIRDVLIPGAATWRPEAVAFGVIGFYALVAVSLSFYVKRFIGQKAWRAIHTMAFGLFVTALLHGIMAGSDSGNPVVVALYAAATAATVTMVAVKVAQSRAPQPGYPPGPRRSQPAPDEAAG